MNPFFRQHCIHICRIMYATHIQNVLSNTTGGGSSSTKSSKIYGDLLVSVFTLKLSVHSVRSFLYSSELPSQLIQVTIVNKSSVLLNSYFPLNFNRVFCVIIRMIFKSYGILISCSSSC